MQPKKVNSFVQWWMTPKLPAHDIFGLPLLMDKSFLAKITHLFSHWVIHPFKRRLARWYLRILQRFTDIKVIGVTGSAGKSTTVQMVASILRQSAAMVATPPSIDPIFNVPNTILRSTPWTKYLILEMSVEYPGEMDYYLWLARPDIGVITNIFPTHTEFLGDIEGVFKEKSKLVKNTKIAVLNKNDKYLRSLNHKLEAEIVWFSGENEAAARAVGKIFGVSGENIEEGLKNYEKPRHRYEIIKHKSGAVIFDDSYNSNPEALLFSLKKFNALAGRNTKIAVLGDMLELGTMADRQHKRIGEEIKKYNFRRVFGVGVKVKFITDDVFANINDLFPILKKYLKKDVYFFIKGSRSIGLDRLVELIHN